MVRKIRYQQKQHIIKALAGNHKVLVSLRGSVFERQFMLHLHCDQLRITELQTFIRFIFLSLARLRHNKIGFAIQQFFAPIMFVRLLRLFCGWPVDLPSHFIEKIWKDME